MLAAGGFAATLAVPPLLPRLRVPVQHAPAISAGAIVLSFFLLFAFIESRVELPVAVAMAFVIGAFGFATVMFADHVRHLSAETRR